jgi:preprotein translocase subunit YajC
MDFFISSAMAQQAGDTSEPSLFVSLLPLIIIFALFYFLLIRPQTRRAKEHRKMVEALKEGDEVVTQGGILGRVTRVEEQFVTVQIADGVKVRVQRHAVGNLMPKGTFESN